MRFLRIWFLITSAVIAAGLMWSFAPILIPVLLVGGGLGIVVLGVVGMARWVETRRVTARVPDADMLPGP